MGSASSLVHNVVIKPATKQSTRNTGLKMGIVGSLNWAAADVGGGMWAGGRRAGQLRTRQTVSHVAAHATASPPQTTNPTTHVPTKALLAAGCDQRCQIWRVQAVAGVPRPLSPPQLPATENSNLSHPPTRTSSAGKSTRCNCLGRC